MPQKEESVSISIRYPEPEHNRADVRVDPEEVTIYCNRKEKPDNPALARTVRWSFPGLREGDHVVVRPKKSQAKSIFASPEGKQHFEARSKEETIVCGLPVFDDDDDPVSFPFRWEYEAVVVRQGEEIGARDPAILIDEDP